MNNKNNSNEENDPLFEASSGDVRILPPDFTLKKIIGEHVDVKQLFSAENIQKAQNVINEHKESFLEWVKKDIEALEQSYKKAASDPTVSQTEIKNLAHAAFVIKSQAGTFGFALGTRVAKSLDDFCNQCFKPTTEHLIVIRKHIDTLSLIFQQNITGDGGTIGAELMDTLSRLVNKYKIQ